MKKVVIFNEQKKTDKHIAGHRALSSSFLVPDRCAGTDILDSGYILQNRCRDSQCKQYNILADQFTLDNYESCSISLTLVFT